MTEVASETEIMDIMVDIETLGTATDSVITQIGAVKFERMTGKIIEKFVVNIDIQDCLRLGLTVDAGAVKFWFDQTKRTFLENTVPLERALYRFGVFCTDPEIYTGFKTGPHKGWAHATFDFPILDNAYRKIGLTFPMKHRNLRDIRTLGELAGNPKYSDLPKTHDALDDCIRQIDYCANCFRILAFRGWSERKEETQKNV